MGLSFGKNISYVANDSATPQKNEILGRADPRSPTIGISRTPLQFPVSTSVCDPRSPSLEIERTPIVVGVNDGQNVELMMDKNDDSLIVNPGSAKNLEEVKLGQISESAVTELQPQLLTTPQAMGKIKDSVKQKLQFDATITPPKIQCGPSRSPLSTRNCNQDQPVDIVRKKQLMKVAERMNVNPVFNKENITSNTSGDTHGL